MSVSDLSAVVSVDASALEKVLTRFSQQIAVHNTQFTTLTVQLRNAESKWSTLSEAKVDDDASRFEALEVRHAQLDLRLVEALQEIHSLKAKNALDATLPKIARFIQRRGSALTESAFGIWVSASAQAREEGRRRDLLVRVISRCLQRDMSAGFQRWRAVCRFEKDADAQLRGVASVVDTLYVKRLCRRAVSQWHAAAIAAKLECICADRGDEALKADQVDELLKAASAPFLRKALTAASRGDGDGAARAAHGATLAVSRVLRAHGGLERAADRSEAAVALTNVRAAAAKATRAAEMHSAKHAEALRAASLKITEKCDARIAAAAERTLANVSLKTAAAHEALVKLTNISAASNDALHRENAVNKIEVQALVDAMRCLETDLNDRLDVALSDLGGALERANGRCDALDSALHLERNERVSSDESARRDGQVGLDQLGATVAAKLQNAIGLKIDRVDTTDVSSEATARRSTARRSLAVTLQARSDATPARSDATLAPEDASRLTSRQSPQASPQPSSPPRSLAPGNRAWSPDSDRQSEDGSGDASGSQSPARRVLPAQGYERTRRNAMPLNQVKGSLWDIIDSNQVATRARLDDVEAVLWEQRCLFAQTLGGAPPRPRARELAEAVFGPFEEVVWQKRRVCGMPRPLAMAAATAARGVARWAAATADLEELARVAGGGASEAGAGVDEVTERRCELTRAFADELHDACAANNGSAGALRLEARARALRRFDDAVGAALSVYDQVLADAATLLGKKPALPVSVIRREPQTRNAAGPTNSRRVPVRTHGRRAPRRSPRSLVPARREALRRQACIACNRPLLSKVRRPPPPLDTQPAQSTVLASAAPPRPISAPAKRPAHKHAERPPAHSASERRLRSALEDAGGFDFEDMEDIDDVEAPCVPT
ncbi:hypothetical protein M885DRAFT_519376 [Pelagophyceae sp. CCMP2097]|nr:hypothetical protein M885DRAFT_519376 [Pelagophyceae sp. CCMP2097]